METSGSEHGDGCGGNSAADKQLHVTNGIHQRGTDNRQQTQIEFAGNLEAKTILTEKGFEKAQGQKEAARKVDQNLAT